MLLLVACSSTQGALLQTDEDKKRKTKYRSKIVVANPTPWDRELVWLSGNSESRVIGRVAALGELELDTFVGHEIGWTKLNDSVIEESITVTSGLERVVLSEAVEVNELPRPTSLDLEKLDRVLDSFSVDALSRELSASHRKAYYAFRVGSVDEWLSRAEERGLDVRSAATRSVERLAGRRETTAAAFEWDLDALAIFYQDGRSCEHAYCDALLLYREDVQDAAVTRLDLTPDSRVPTVVALNDVEDLVAPTKVRRLFWWRRRKRILRLACDALAVWLARTGAKVTCLDANRNNRATAFHNARRLGLGLVPTQTPPKRTKFDLVYATDDDEAGGGDSLATVLDHVALRPRPGAARMVPSPHFRDLANKSHAILSANGAWLLPSSSAARLPASLSCSSVDIPDRSAAEARTSHPGDHSYSPSAYDNQTVRAAIDATSRLEATYMLCRPPPRRRIWQPRERAVA